MTTNNSNTNSLISKKPRGRPRKHPLPNPTIIKKRGRPCKNLAITHIVDKIFDNSEDNLKPRKRRGRPPKQTADEHDADFIEHDIDQLVKIKDRAVELKKKEDKQKYYVDTKRLAQIIKEYYTSEVITDELATALYNIAYRISFMPNFINYSWKEEMIGDGLIKELLALKNKKFNPLKGKAFSYFSMIVYNAFCNRIKKENKINDVVKEYQSEQYDSLMMDQGVKTTTNSEGENFDD